MFKALDPKLAELCYVDTDSCIWSLSHPQLSACLKRGAERFWQRADILADESGPTSCHGKLKNEGTYDGGQFKAVKIYRLYNKGNGEDEEEQELQLQAGSAFKHFKKSWLVAYTRCKGVERRTADSLPNLSFDPDEPIKSVVHRTVLRPTRAGEMLMKLECRSLAVPFNFKRRVCDYGLHTFCIE